MTKIWNLYDPRGQAILSHPRCYATEKVDGCPAAVRWLDGHVHLSPGASGTELFRAIFDVQSLTAAFRALASPRVVVYGEAYGGRQQGLSARYGRDLRFVAFDVHIGDEILPVPAADALVRLHIGLDHVPWVETSTDLAALNALRDAPSELAARIGMGHQLREGIVLRPLTEGHASDPGPRVIAKHRGAHTSETRTVREVHVEARVAYQKADDYALEWVTEERLRHVATRVQAHLGRELTRNDTGHVVASMLRDVRSEAPEDEVPTGAEVDKALKRRTAALYLARF